MKRKLNEKAQVFVEARAKGINRDQSSIIAYGTDENAHRHEVTVSDELARIRAETAQNTGVTKEDVVGMLVDAGSMARTIGDPSGLVAAARELGKMLGFYAPEVKKTLHGVDQATLKKALAEMTDDELYKLAHAKAIDGQFSLIENSEETVQRV